MLPPRLRGVMRRAAPGGVLGGALGDAAGSVPTGVSALVVTVSVVVDAESATSFVDDDVEHAPIDANAITIIPIRRVSRPLAMNPPRRVP